MKYVVLIYANPRNWQHPLFLQYEDHAEEERTRLLAKFNAFNVELEASGQLLSGAPLAAPETTKTITERNGVVSITDGPFAEAKEQLAGFLLVDCETIDDAYDIAKNFPDIKYAAVEIRPLAI
ncbi:YciI family protein [soil metagenome]